MLDGKGFDLWADGYDKSVNLCEEADEYPFAGYKDVVNEIYNTIHKKENARVLDIGFGTGVLTKKLYDDGYRIYGIDFSERMIEIAKTKMPNAILIQHNFAKGLPKELFNRRFDFIVSTYAIHHLTDTEKLELITQSLKCISADGMILIGDVAFGTRSELNVCKEKSGDDWDTDEFYIVFEELKLHFKEDKVQFHKVSHCAGVITIINSTAIA
jgi:putative AdoMet-dependent methyltransferase